MELIPDSVCILCEDKPTSVLNRKCMQPYIKIIGDTFFDGHKHAFTQFQKKTTNKNFCALCIQKIVISNRLKNSYEDLVRKNNHLKKSISCLLCKRKGVDLLRTTENPNDFSTKITVFMNSTSHPTSHENCAICFDCLFNINIWYEAHDNLFKKFNLEDVPRNVEYGNHNSFSDDGVVQTDKENFTPPHNNIQASKKDKKFRSTNKRSLLTLNRNLNRRSATKGTKINVNATSTRFHQILKQQLKNCKTLKEMKKNEINFPWNISSDPKMFYQIPYVLLSREQSERSTRRSSRKKSMEVIVLSDSDEKSAIKPVVPKLFIRAPVKPTPKKFLPKLKIKMNYTKYVCNICDLQLYNACKYKSHTLWHEKPERFQINLVRSNLPTHAKVSEFNSSVTTATADIAEDVTNTVVSSLSDKPYECCPKSTDVEESLNLHLSNDSIHDAEHIPTLEVAATNSEELSKLTTLHNESISIEERDSEKGLDLSHKSKNIVVSASENKSDDDGGSNDDTSKNILESDMENKSDDDGGINKNRSKNIAESDMENKSDDDGEINEDKSKNISESDMENKSDDGGINEDRSKNIAESDTENKSDEDGEHNVSENGSNNNLESGDGEEDQLVSEDLSLSPKPSSNNKAADANTSFIDSDDTTTNDDVANALSKLYQDDSANKCGSDASTDSDIGDSNSIVRKRRRLSYSDDSDSNTEDQAIPKLKKVRFAIDYSIPKNRDVTDTNRTNETTLYNSDEFLSANEAEITDI